MLVRATLSSNIPAYAELAPEQPEGIAAQRVNELAPANGVICNQALLEFAAVVRRRLPPSLPGAVTKVDAWSQVFETAPTRSFIMAAALRPVTAPQFQIGGAVIWSADRAAQRRPKRRSSSGR